MCGLTGFWQAGGFDAEAARPIAERMAVRLAHRGPDAAGVWLDPLDGIALAHRRLAVVDLSSAGHQPMHSASQRYVLVFNGEIYNHGELRQELTAGGGQAWRGHSDSETLLACIEAWGLEKTLQRACGMFAIALWDRRDGVLSLARDRFGEKPLYYGFQGSRLLFASELKAFAAHPDFAADIDRGALSLYIRHGCVPAPHCIYRGICKLPAGSWLQLPLRSAGTAAAANSPLAYWRLSDAVERGRARPFVGSASDAAAALEDTLGRAVRRQMLADVPLGAFLSGGIDSSAIVSLMQAQSSRPIRTFAVGFTEAEYNEAGYAKAVAEHLHTEHTELYLTPGDALGVIPQLAQIYDEPFADSSQIPTVLLARMARRHVTVALSGDAGDEMLCGYNRYRVAARWGVLAKIPLPLRRLTGRLLQRVGPDNWRRLFDRLGRQVALPAAMTEKLDKFALQLQRADDVAALYYGLVSALDDPGRVVVGGGEPATWLTRIGLAQAFADPQAHMMFLDAMSYLPDDILVKVDRAAMAASLETRMPFLDPDFVEFAWSLPAGLKFRQGQGKWLLRQMLYRRVPQALLERPKSGFAIPLGDWLAGPLRDWCESLLAPERLRREGFFDVDFVGQCWHQHRSRQREWQTLLWNVLMFQSWLEGGRG